MLKIGQVAGSATAPDAAAAEVLELFRSIVPYAAASISTWNPFTDRHQTIVNAQYPPAVVTHLDTWFVCHDEVYELMRTVDATPLRWRDTPFDYRRMYSAREVFMPVGYDEGATTCLYTVDGRYTGSLHVSTDTRRHPSDAAMDALDILQSTLAGLVDALRFPSWLATSLAPREAAGVITSGGDVVALPGHSLGSHLAPGGPLARLVISLARQHRGLPRFLWQDDAGSWHRVRLHGLADAVVVVESVADLPRGLTPRELEVLTSWPTGSRIPRSPGR